MSTELARRTDALVGRVVKKLAQEAPRLADLSPEELRSLARVVIAEELRDQLKDRVRLERIDHPAERETFLKSCSRTRSPHTQKAYAAGLARLEAWCDARGLKVPALTPAQADDWITDLRAEGRSAASVSLDVAGASSYFTWLARRHKAELAVNPFRGTKARPPAKARRELVVPFPEEVDRMIAAASGELRAAVVVMARLGLRVGALPGLKVNGDRYTTVSKGKPLAGRLPPGIRQEIERAGLPLRGPFAGRTADQLKDRFRYLVRKLYDAKALSARYSVHDLRHAFAKSTYKDGKDLYATSRALGHADINMSARYLRSLDLDVEQARWGRKEGTGKRNGCAGRPCGPIIGVVRDSPTGRKAGVSCPVSLAFRKSKSAFQEECNMPTSKNLNTEDNAVLLALFGVCLSPAGQENETWNRARGRLERGGLSPEKAERAMYRLLSKTVA